MKQQRIVKYARLLREHRNPNAQAVRTFMQKHDDDPSFQRRARKLNQLFMSRCWPHGE